VFWNDKSSPQGLASSWPRLARTRSGVGGRRLLTLSSRQSDRDGQSQYLNADFHGIDKIANLRLFRFPRGAPSASSLKDLLVEQIGLRRRTRKLTLVAQIPTLLRKKYSPPKNNLANTAIFNGGAFAPRLQSEAPTFLVSNGMINHLISNGRSHENSYVHIGAAISI
jgi:hypothetical protein